VSNDNPALLALREVDESTIDSDMQRIINGIKTCGPIISAAINNDSSSIDSDIDDMLSEAQKLIKQVLSSQELCFNQLKANEIAAINAFCIKVVCENWKQSQEVYEEWPNAIVHSLLKSGICAEYRSSEFKTEAGCDLASNILACGEIFCTLVKLSKSFDSTTIYQTLTKQLFNSVDKAVEKLTKFHIPFEDANLIRHHFTIQAGRIFVSVIEREYSNFTNSQRHSTLSDDNHKPQLSFDEICRFFSTAMDSFVTSIYVNSRMVN
jgi:hypothetical protein